MTGGRRRHSLSGREGLRTHGLLLLVAMLFALCGQSFLTQTHLHFPTEDHWASNGGSAGTGHQSVGHSRSPDHPVDCPICQEQAVSGHYLSPTPFLFVAPVLLSLRAFILPLSEQSAARRSHGWQSRAPPASLQN